MPDAGRPMYRLLLKAEPPRGWLSPPVVRLRIALKVMLRAFGLRAVEVKEVEAGGQEPEKADGPGLQPETRGRCRMGGKMPRR
jgi:hypothetical protein